MLRLRPARRAALWVVCFLLACGLSTEQDYEVTGRIEGVDVQNRQLTIAHDPIPVVGQQREKRPRGQRPSKLGRIKEPDLTRPPREHAQSVLNAPDRPTTISAAF